MTLINHFLESLSPDDFALLHPALASVDLARGTCIAEAGQLVDRAHFPKTCILSVITVMENGDRVESRTIGRESGFGLLHAIGSRYSDERIEVQVGGEAWSISVEELGRATQASPTLLIELVRHAQATIVQAARSTACIAFHPAQARMCRWLLMTRDRLGSSLLPLTQEHLAIMLGVQRTTVTAVAQDLQVRGLIRYSRGRIQLLKEEEILRCACECYDTIERAVENILPDSRRT